MKRHFLGVSLACVLAASTVLSAVGCKQKTDNSENTLEIYAAEFGYGYEWLNDMIAAFRSRLGKRKISQSEYSRRQA